MSTLRTMFAHLCQLIYVQVSVQRELLFYRDLRSHLFFEFVSLITRTSDHSVALVACSPEMY